MKSSGKWMQQEKNHSEIFIPDPEREIWCLFDYKCVLAAKSILTKLKSIEAQWLGIEKGNMEEMQEREIKYTVMDIYGV